MLSSALPRYSCGSGYSSTTSTVFKGLRRAQLRISNLHINQDEHQHRLCSSLVASSSIIITIIHNIHHHDVPIVQSKSIHHPPLPLGRSKTSHTHDEHQRDDQRRWLDFHSQLNTISRTLSHKYKSAFGTIRRKQVFLPCQSKIIMACYFLL